MAEAELPTSVARPAAGDQPVAAPRRVTLAMLVTAGLEAALFVAAAAGHLAPFAALGVHLVVVVLLAIALREYIRTGSDGGVALMGLVGTLTTGPFGAGCAALLPSLSSANRRAPRRVV
jgi:hypothetical protein